jgi:hypothetical protein
MAKWILASLMFCAVLLVACDSNSSKSDSSPNAKLNNRDLITKAVANMKALKSYHMEVEGTLASMPDFVRISGDVQSNEKGSKIKASDNPTPGNMTLTPNAEQATSESVVNVIMSGGNWYESYDDESTWTKPEIDSPAFLFIASVALIWDTRFAFESPTNGERMIHAAILEEGDAASEQLDRTPVRHIKATFDGTRDIGFGGEAALLFGAKSLDIWVSTNETPTVMQMHLDSADPTSGAEHSLTWSWSQFNEDLGTIGPPPTASVTSTPE